MYSRYTRNTPRIAAAKGEIWDPDQVIKVSRKKTKVGDDDGEQLELLLMYGWNICDIEIPKD